MDSTRFERIAQLFDRARPLDGPARAEFMAALSDSTRQEVEALLTRDAGPHGLLDEPIADLTAGAAGPAPSDLAKPPIPESIGAYRVLEEIGLGGMGVVYRAEQQSPRRTVALKVIRAPVASARNVRRFRQESELLGRLQHPGIAHVHEAGQAETPFGTVPYFAMEYVDGEPIVEYAVRVGLSTRERLVLFGRVCAAVQHAHQRGIVHRDLKPANILVDRQRQPKVLDFGIARVLDPDHADTTLGTDVGQLLGTLPYMSPEQFDGDPNRIDALSDVYAMGVVLYELLAERLPHDVRDRSWPDAARIIRESEPAPLSRIRRAYRGDLDTIVSKALAKERERRYLSVADLAADIDRFLRCEPIIARPTSTVYQLRKFARRHRPLVAAAVLLFVVLAAGVIVSTALFVRTARHAEALRGAIYAQNISLAHSAFELTDMARMQELLAACDEDLRHWEWDRLHALADDSVVRLQAHTSDVGVMAFSPDGRWLASGGSFDEFAPEARRDRSVQVWDVESLMLRHRFDAHRTRVRALAWSHDGRVLASGGSTHWSLDEAWDGALRLWDVERGILAESLVGFDGIDALAYGEGDRLFVGGITDELSNIALEAWDPDGRRRRFGMLENGYWGLAISRDQRRVASSDWSGNVSVWDARSGERLASWHLPSPTRTVALNRDGSRVIAGCDEPSVRLFDVGSGAELLRIEGHTDWITTVAFSLDDSTIISASNDQTIRLWDATTGEVTGMRRGARGFVSTMAIDPLGRYIAGGDREGHVFLWAVDQPAFDSLLQHDSGHVNQVDWDPTGSRVVSAADDHTVRIWSVKDGTCMRILRVESRFVHAVAWSPDGDLIAALDFAGRATVWHADTGDVVASWSAHAAVGLDLVFSPDSRLLATSARAAGVRLWNPRDGALVRALESESGVEALSFAPDGRALFGAETTGAVVRWDPHGGSLQRILDPGLRIKDLDVSPDGTILLVTQADRLRAWRLDDAIVEWEVEIHRTRWSGSFSADGRRVVTAGEDGIVNVIDAITGRHLLALRADLGPLNDARFDPTGRRIASCGRSANVRVWESRSSQEPGGRSRVGRLDQAATRAGD